MSERKNLLAQGGVLFLLLAVRACAFGFEYWPQLDDYIQYCNYMTNETFMELQQKVGLLASRPLAGLADYFVWGQLFDHMILGVFLISALYILCVVLMRKLLSRYFRVSPLFMVIMALLPLGVEATYWMSAASRIVMGLLCACLAGLAFAWWLDRGKWYCGAVFALAMLLPFGFYEQSAILAMTLVLGMGILECRKRPRRAVLALWALPAVAVYFAIVGQLSTGTVYASRMELVLPNSDYYWNVFLPEVLKQVRTVFFEGNFYTLAKGFLRGLRLILGGELLLWCLLPVLLSVLLGLLVWKEGERERKNKVPLALLAGFLLALAPVTLFFVLANPWFSFRCAATSFAGIALFCDTLVMALCGRLPAKRLCLSVLAGAAALVFTIAGATEIGDYKGTYESDHRAVQVIMQTLERDDLLRKDTTSLRVGFLGMEPSHLPDQNYHWHEHVTGCTESNWALSGLLRSQLPADTQLPGVYPLPTWPIYRNWNHAVNDPTLFDRLYWYDGHSATPITLQPSGEKRYDVLLPDGTLLGRVVEQWDGTGYFEAP